MRNPYQDYLLSTGQLKGLLFWARIGINGAVGGSHSDTPALVNQLTKLLKISEPMCHFKESSNPINLTVMHPVSDERKEQ